MRGIQPQREDVAALLLTPLMSGKMSQLECIMKGFQWMEESCFEMNQEERFRMESVLYAFAVKFLKKEEQDIVKEGGDFID